MSFKDEEEISAAAAAVTTGSMLQRWNKYINIWCQN